VRVEQRLTPPRPLDDASGHGHVSVLDSPVRRQILDLLAAMPVAEGGARTGLSAAELGQRLGVHPTTARFHLTQLEDNGLVESLSARGRVGRPRKLYRVSHRPVPSSPAGGEAMQTLLGLLSGPWQEGGHEEQMTPEEAGRRWALEHARAEAVPSEQATSPGAWLGKVGATVDLLAGWGYQPEVRTEDAGRTAELTLLDCPFLALARTHADVVCGVHRGLLRGALEAVGEPDADVGLRPLVTPRRCLARVSTRADLAAPVMPVLREPVDDAVLEPEPVGDPVELSEL
jgi:predicted ArsR family transcriptional regulator